MPDANRNDIDLVLSKRHANGGDFWASADGRIYTGHPFSTIGALVILHELGVPARHEAVAGALRSVRKTIRPDGRVQVAPGAPLYPCYTAEATRALARFAPKDKALGPVLAYLHENAHDAGGWRCSFSRFGKGPETLCANPGATLFALDALRFTPSLTSGDAIVDAAVESLLDHWTVRKPIGPCHYGMGSTFFAIEFPFLRYNLFYYVYVLSFFERARRDERFRAALAGLEGQLGPGGSIVVAQPHRSLAKFTFCEKGAVSALATVRMEEIRGNLGTRPTSRTRATSMSSPKTKGGSRQPPKRRR